MPLLRSRSVDGRVHFGHALDDYARRGLLAKIAQRAGVTLPPTSQVATGKALPAILHGDAWVVQCPDCGTGAFVWLDRPLVMCAYCFNVKAGGLWRRVAVPKDREAIEAIVGHRPFAHQRNWLPGVSLSALRRQNIENGDPIPEGGD